MIDAPYPFVAINDLPLVAETLGAPLEADTAGRLTAEFGRIQRKHAPAESTFFSVESERLSAALERTVRDALVDDDRIGVVYLDQYLGRGPDCPPHFRLEVSRGSDESLMPRVGCATSVEEQIAGLADWAREREHGELLLVDDVLAFGSTLPVLAESLRERIPGVRIRFLAGLAASGGVWRGVERVRETGIEPEYLTRILASEPIEGRTRGMALPVARDFTVFGGRGGVGAEGAQLTHPYFLPFSKPLLSLIDRPAVLASAEDFLTFNDRLVEALESSRGSTLRAADLSGAGYGLPCTALESVRSLLPPPTPEQPVGELLRSAREVLCRNVDRVMAELD